MINWLQNSGISVTINLNPLHWWWIPKAYTDKNNEWPTSRFRSWNARWLFVRIHVYIDDGSW
jgi:hypothetical protein